MNLKLTLLEKCYNMEHKNEESSLNFENKIETKMLVGSTSINICGLCLQKSSLLPLTSSQFAKDFDNFNFIQVEIDCKFPENICTECIGKLDQIGLFLKTCQNSYHIYNTWQEIRVEANKVENEVLHESEMKQEETESDCEVVILLSEESEIVSTEFPDIAEENTIKEEQDTSKCEEANPLEINFKDESKKYKKQNDPNQIKICYTCGASVSKLASHYEISRSCKPRNFSCLICNLHFPASDRLSDHQRLHHSDGDAMKLFKCEICTKEFKYERNLDRHVLVHKFGKRFMCEICGKRFFTKAALNDHKNVHTQTRPYSCKFCGKCFHAQGTLFFHQRRHLKKEIKKPEGEVAVYKNEQLFCEICNRKFSKIGPLKLHLKSHDENRTYPCKKCNDEFETFQLYKEHCKIHKPKKGYHCPHCEKSFMCASHLEIHVRIHTGERPFKCLVCDSRFRISAHLNTHMMLIHGVNRGKPFECKFCKKTFLLKDRLVCHERIHTGERPFNCHVCDKSFIDRSSRKKHLKKLHGEGEI